MKEENILFFLMESTFIFKDIIRKKCHFLIFIHLLDIKSVDQYVCAGIELDHKFDSIFSSFLDFLLLKIL